MLLVQKEKEDNEDIFPGYNAKKDMSWKKKTHSYRVPERPLYSQKLSSYSTAVLFSVPLMYT